MLFSVLLYVSLFTAIFAECLFLEKSISHGRIIYEEENDVNLTYAPNNYLLRFQCDNGYQLTAPPHIFCIKDIWSQDLPQCVKLDCPRPPDLNYGTFEIQRGRLNNPVIGSEVTYSCNSGYEMRIPENNTLSCALENGTALWSGFLSPCIEKVSCTDPGVSPHGLRTGPCCSDGNVVTYRCRRKYELIGEESIVCLLGGRWSSPRPRCRPRKFCPDPPHIENGSVIGEKKGDFYVKYHEVTVKCNRGFSFYGEKKYVFCNETFNWNVEFGECRETFCSRPSSLTNGTIIELEMTNATEFADGFELTYHCNNGFRLNGDSRRKCIAGLWSNKEPYCEEIHCYNPGIPDYGMRKGDDFSIGSRVIYTCFSGFVLVGSIQRYCLSTGQWSGETTSCDLKTNYCPNPGVPINGKKLGNSYGENEVIEYICSPGFKLIGSRFRQCLKNRTWSGEEPKCIGKYDYDNEKKVSAILRSAVVEKTKLQATELYESIMTELGETENKEHLIRQIIDSNNSERLIFYFIFDVSGSIGEKFFLLSVEFTKALVKKIGVANYGARFAALTFSSRTKIEFLPPQYETTEEVLAALNSIEFEGGKTATSNALQIVYEQVIPLTKELYNSDTKPIIFILTDGKANTGGHPKEKADLLKESGAEIYCIGITNDINEGVLYDIASEPHNEHVFILRDYARFDWLVQELINGTIDYSQCGVSLHRADKQFHPRMYGGEKVIQPWPWMATLYYKDMGFPERLICGGSIIDKRWILTAAHCLVTNGLVQPLSSIIINLGVVNLYQPAKLQRHEAEEFIIHPKYNSSAKDNDIALIKLVREIEYNSDVLAVCLPPIELPSNTVLYKEDELISATGWGYDEKYPEGERPLYKPTKHLKEIVVPIQPREVCLQCLLDRNFTADKLTDNMFCAGNGDGRSATCSGDSGGPLIQEQPSEQGFIYWTQIGIVSWGLGCGQQNTYGFYTNVHRFISWIHSNLNSTQD